MATLTRLAAVLTFILAWVLIAESPIGYALADLIRDIHTLLTFIQHR